MKHYLTMRGQEIKILELEDFIETINSEERVEIVMHGLTKDFEIYNSRIAINYSDEGYALFEIVQNLPHVLIILFTGTAA